jgi:hypothetical protein
MVTEGKQLTRKITMERIRYDVVPDGDGWKITMPPPNPSNCATKEAAVAAAVAMARGHQPSQVLIHRADGTIEDERTYQDDPFPPQG